MTTTRPPATAGWLPSPDRLLRIARLQFVAWRTSLTWPWGILAISFVINLLLFAAFERQGLDDATTGGLSALYIVLAVGYYQTMTRDFSFALSMGVTRRAFHLATVGFAVVQAAVYGLVVLLLRQIEKGTGGWGVDLEFFGPSYTQVGNPVLQWLVYTVPLLLVVTLGMALGTVVKRWGSNGVMVLTAGMIAVGGLLATVATLLSWWGPIGNWLTEQPTAALFAGWPALVAAVVGLLGYLGLRRATP